jgi:hypothetical protein
MSESLERYTMNTSQIGRGAVCNTTDLACAPPSASRW